jgi:hypothetical protein
MSELVHEEYMRTRMCCKLVLLLYDHAYGAYKRMRTYANITMYMYVCVNI